MTKKRINKDVIIFISIFMMFFSITTSSCLAQIRVKSERQLTFGKGEDQSPSWSPDGHSIAYHSLKGKKYKIMIIPAEGGKPKELSTSKSDETYPVWSPDGKRIAFLRHKTSLTSGSRLSNNIAVMDTNGKNAVLLTKDGTGKMHLTWTPDGKNIIYSEARGTGKSFETDVWMVDVSSKEKTKLIDGYKEKTANEDDLMVGGLSIENNGHILFFDAAFFETSDILKRGIFSMDIRTRTISNIVGDMDRAWSPKISPNGEWIVFHSGKKGINGLWIVSPDGETKAQLIKSGNNNRHPAWSPDGRQIAYTKGLSYDAKLWILELVYNQ